MRMRSQSGKGQRSLPVGTEKKGLQVHARTHGACPGSDTCDVRLQGHDHFGISESRDLLLDRRGRAADSGLRHGRRRHGDGRRNESRNRNAHVGPGLRDLLRNRRILREEIARNRDGFDGAFLKIGGRRQTLGQGHIPDLPCLFPGIAANGLGSENEGSVRNTGIRVDVPRGHRRC